VSPTIFVATGVVLAIAVIAAAMLRAQRRREEKDEQSLADAVAQNLHLPVSLHPVIDPKACIGCLACLRACPEGDILGVVDGKAQLITATNCIGHGKCAVECPTDAIKLVFGTAERGVDLPEVDQFFESSRPGVHVAGQLGGMVMIRNAIPQGVQVAERLASIRSTSRPGITDVAIVGAGPAGLATALGCRAAGVSVQVLEQSTVGGTIAHYPRQKVVMIERVRLPIYGKFGKRLISKEELLSTWGKAIAKAKLSIEEGVKVEGLEGSDNQFVLKTNRGAVHARKVVLATGRRGSPRKLGVPGEQLSNVSYGLVDPEQYQGCRVLVVGGGDSAVEAACQLAEQSDAQVVISYRQQTLGKCREANRQKIQELIRTRRIHALMPSQVKEIRAKEALIEFSGKTRRLPNDFVLALIGGELPLEMLRGMQIAVKRYHGSALGEAPSPAGARKKRPRALAEKKDRRLGMGAFHPRCSDRRWSNRCRLGLLPTTGARASSLPPALRLEAGGTVGPRNRDWRHRGDALELPLCAAQALEPPQPRGSAPALADVPYVRRIPQPGGDRISLRLPIEEPPRHGHGRLPGDRRWHRRAWPVRLRLGSDPEWTRRGAGRPGGS